MTYTADDTIEAIEALTALLERMPPGGTSYRQKMVLRRGRRRVTVTRSVDLTDVVSALAALSDAIKAGRTADAEAIERARRTLALTLWHRPARGELSRRRP